MKNLYDADKNEAAIPDNLHAIKSVNGKSKHRIIHYDWTIHMIRAIIGLYLNALALTLIKIPVALMKKNRVTKKLLIRYRQTGYYIKRLTDRKKYLLVLGILMIFFFTKSRFQDSVSKIKTTDNEINIQQIDGSVYRNFICTKTVEKIKIKRQENSTISFHAMHNLSHSGLSENPHFIII